MAKSLATQPTIQQMVRRYTVVLAVLAVLAAGMWLPMNESQTGSLPIELRLRGWLGVFWGPIEAVMFELSDERLRRHPWWTAYLVLTLFGLWTGLRWRRVRMMRLIGYVAVGFWVLVGLSWSVAGA